MNYFKFVLGLFFLLLLALLIYFVKKNKKQNLLLKKQEKEISNLKYITLSYEQNMILSNILKNTGKQSKLNTACKNIVNILLESFDIDFCTILLANSRGYNYISATNIRNAKEKKYLEQFTNEELSKGRANEGAIVYSSKNCPLQYSFAKDRSIRYYFLIPLNLDNEVIGSLVIENFFVKNIEQFEEDFFNIVVENICIVIQNLIYKQKFIDMGLTDGLTGAYNRKYMNSLLEEEIQKHKERQEHFNLTIFDIDHFKKFNDTYGHLFGDLVLKDLTKFFKENVREDDVFIRYGGEEFIIFFPMVSNKEIFNRLDELRVKLSETELTDGKATARVTSSFGLAEYPTDGTTLEDIIKKADDALYYSKRNGRNQVNMFSNIFVEEKG